MWKAVLPRSIVVLLAASFVTGFPSSAGDEILTSGKKLYSQFDEELVIRHFFDDRRDGFFVDVGAYHWKKSSTTYYLEKHLGWSGIAIDAQGRFARGYAEHRPRTKFFNYIVTDHSGTEETLFLMGPISSTVKSHIADVARETGIEDENKELESLELRETRLPTITLNELLDANGVSRIDFLSMDIEQGEAPALAGFDIERFRPKLVCIEAFASSREPIVDYFARHGYERIEKYVQYDHLNWYFTPKQSPAAN